MDSANNALSAIHKVMPIERVEELMDNVADSIDYQSEIDRALVGNAVTVDEDSLEAELDSLMKSLTESPVVQPAVNLPIAPTTPIMPLPPSTTPVISNTSSERTPGELLAS